MTDPTPTRDEAVPTGWKLVPVDPTEEMIEAMCDAYRQTRRPGVSGMTLDAQFRAEFAQWFAAYSAMLASAPAPASGGVDAVREALLGYVLKPGQYETASVFARGQNRVAVDMLGVLDEASLSPAATPVSGADMIPRAKNVGRYLAETNDGRLLYLNHATEWQEMPNIPAKPASSPAGVYVVQTLIDKTEKLIEAAEYGPYTPKPSPWWHPNLADAHSKNPPEAEHG